MGDGRRIRASRPRPPPRGGSRPKGRRRRTRIPVPRTHAQTSRGLGREPETGHEENSHGHFSVPHAHVESRGEKRKTRHEEDARTRDLAQRTPAAAGEAAADRGADGGDEAAAAGGGVNAGAHAAGAAMEVDEGADAEAGGAREACVPAKTTPRRESASAPAPPSPISREPPAGLGAAAWRTPTRARALGTPRDPPAPQR